MKHFLALLLVLIVTICAFGFGDVLSLNKMDYVFFNDIPLGTPYKEFVKQLKKQGFKMYKERVEVQMFYGVCKEAFMGGKINGNNAVVHLYASSKSQVVFRIEVVLRDLIDEEEAIDEADRLLADEKARYVAVLPESMPLNNQLIDLSNRGKVTRYLCYPRATAFFRLYGSPCPSDTKESFGSIEVGIYENSIPHEHLVYICYFDRVSAKIAEQEAAK